MKTPVRPGATPAPAPAASPVSPAHSLRAQLVLTAAMALWGLNIPAVRVLAGRFDFATLAAVRMFFTCCVFAVLALRASGRLPGIERRHWPLLLACSALMVYGNQVFFTSGMARTSATNSALIVALGPLVSSLLAAIAFRERLALPRLAGIALGLAGVAGVILHRPGAGVGAAGIGDLLVGSSVLSFALGGVLVQRLARQLDVLAISWGIYLVGTVFLALHAAVAGFDQRILSSGWQSWSLILFSGVAASAIGNLIWNRSIGILGISRTALFLNWVPLFAIAFAVAFLDEPFSWWLVFGFGCVVCGTCLGALRRT